MVQRKKLKIVTEKHDEKTLVLPESEASKFINNLVPHDLLVEILIRLPDSRATIRCTSVCKRWRSLISDLAFVRALVALRGRIDQSYASYTFHLSFVALESSCVVFSEKSKALHGDQSSSLSLSPSSLERDYLGFLPLPKVDLLASCDDLLLVSEDRLSSFDLYICNPLTKQWIALRSPCLCEFYGLVSDPNSKKFKVILISFSSGNYCATAFSSETGRWSDSTFILSFPKKGAEQIVACNGILYWLLGRYDKIKAMAAFDPYSSRCRRIDLPGDFRQRWPLNTNRRVRLGVVRGRVRLMQWYKKHKCSQIVLRIWELKYYDINSDEDNGASTHTWNLVLRIRRRMTDSYVVGFDPENGDAVIMFKGFDIVRYRISEETCENIGKFPKNSRTVWGWNLTSFTLLHPSWPTFIPPLAQSHSH